MTTVPNGDGHVPVLRDAVVAALVQDRSGRYIDATIDGGGHAAALLDATAPAGRVLGIDRDGALLAAAAARFADPIEEGRMTLVHASFAALRRIAAAHAFVPADGILFDLGLSSHHLDRSGRGFSFSRDEPLDMRFDAADSTEESAADLLATRDADELTHLFRTYGEERFASRIARTIVARRRAAPLRTTAELLGAIEQSLPPAVRWRAARHAARVFQALRIAVNAEIDAVRSAIPDAVAMLAPRGRLAVISFHSLEDRIIKHALRAAAQAGAVRVLTRKPTQPSAAEIAVNPRAASAKLRVAERA